MNRKTEIVTHTLMGSYSISQYLTTQKRKQKRKRLINFYSTVKPYKTMLRKHLSVLKDYFNHEM
jgi:hypothetical protein